ncbi:phosphodiester glycosidase family protein [Pedobacter flavus]|uniref:Phosphodiester glycosidase family protein n=1 Tax=Pedobacter flavus TaxID=3113906 RepID=A0ABU7H046_9SPHI|nr:phosphodiester glycosidase family protein [Pedobacter sp. VNH31]MEE1884447.1 phosphodiester glycosidase family protein [Pedobacter sp. VNH31]
MKKLVLTFNILLFFVGLAVAQSIDSLNIVNAKWKTQKIAPHTRLKTYHFSNNSLFNANQYISFVEIKNKGKKVKLSLGADSGTLYKTSEFGIKNNALLAINGTFFDIKNGGSVDYIRANGQLINSNKLDNNQRARHQQAAITIDKGRLAIKKWDNTLTWEEELKESDIMVSGPLLIYKNSVEALDKSSFTTARHPRTVVGVKKNGNVILLTVDGRHENSAGMSLNELTLLMKWLGSEDALNLDGGGSTTLWLNNNQENGVVNYPSDNKKWDHEGERKVANVILLKKN